MAMNALAQRIQPTIEIPGWVPVEHQQTYQLIAINKGEEEAASVARKLKASSDAGWTANRIEMLVRMWIDGASAAATSAVLGEGFTRNAVIGKRHRLGLQSETLISRPAKPAVFQPKTKPAPKPAALPAPQPKTEAPPAPIAAALIVEDRIPKEGVPFMETRVFQCRYHLVDAGCESICCGARTARGSYCATHAPLIYAGTVRVDRAILKAVRQ